MQYKIHVLYLLVADILNLIVDQANGTKKVSIKSSLRITKSGAKRLSREVMVKGIYGAKKVSLAASTSEIRDKSSSVRTKTGISNSIKTASWNGLSKIKY